MLGRCEQICKTVRSASEVAWKYYEEEQIGRKSTSATSNDVRIRVNRFCMASSFVREKVELDIRHTQEDYVSAIYGDEREHYCPELFANLGDADYIYDAKTCPFPDKFNTSFMDNPDDFELFMRITIGSGFPPIFEGFVPPENIRTERRDEGRGPILSINFRGLDFSRWQGMGEMLSLEGDRANGKWATLNSHIVLKNVTLVALPKSIKIVMVRTLRAGLVCAYSSFRREEEEGDWKYDDARFEIGAEACIPSSPHKSVDLLSPHASRYIRLVKEKIGGNFVGWKIEDESALILPE